MQYITRHAGLGSRGKQEYPNSQVRKLISNNEAEKNPSRLTEPPADDSLKLFRLISFVTLAVLVRRFVTLVSCVLGIVTLPSRDLLFLVFLIFVTSLSFAVLVSVSSSPVEAERFPLSPSPLRISVLYRIFNPA
jgi:hypothetical protein